MDDVPNKSQRIERPPLHFWAFGILSLLWFAWGAYIAISAQTGQLPGLRSADAAYFNAQPTWLVVVANLGLLAGMGGAVALMLQHRSAVWLYAAPPCTILLTNLYEVAAGASPILTDRGALFGTIFLLVMMALAVLYARAMRRRGFLE